MRCHLPAPDLLPIRFKRHEDKLRVAQSCATRGSSRTTAEYDGPVGYHRYSEEPLAFGSAILRKQDAEK